MNEYRQHWWKCNGPCQHRPPYYGVVKRAMNRPPSNKDSWWGKHQETCGGTYTKIKEPDDYKKKGKTNGGECSKTPRGDKSADIKKLMADNIGSSTLKESFEKTDDAKFNGSGYTLKQKSLSKQFSKPSEAAAYAAQKRHSQTSTSPANKRMKGPSKGKEITKVNKRSVTKISSVNRSIASSSKTKPPGNDIRDLLCKKESNDSVSDNVPCSSTTIISQQDEDVIDLTDDNACPICGFTSIKADVLSTHINKCLVTFAS